MQPGRPPRRMRRLAVNFRLANIFKGVLESWIRSKSGKKFAEIRWAKNTRIGVYHIRIKPIAGVGKTNALLTRTPLQGTCESRRRAMTKSGRTFGGRYKSLFQFDR
jgi:hypothetical protein